MNCIRPFIQRDDALARFAGRWYVRWFRAVTASVQGSRDPIAGLNRTLPHVELNWLPYYLVEFELVDRGRETTAAVLVGGHEPSAALVDRRRLEWEEIDNLASFDPLVDADEAIQQARQAIQRALTRRGSWRISGEPTLAGPPKVIHHPYWTYYYTRRRDRLDVRLLDAVTGRPCGPKVKTSLLLALEASRNRQMPAQAPATV